MREGHGRKKTPFDQVSFSTDGEKRGSSDDG